MPASLGTKDKCRHCGRDILFHRPEIVGETFLGRTSYKSAWYHIGAPPEELLSSLEGRVSGVGKIEDIKVGSLYPRCLRSSDDMLKKATPTEFCDETTQVGDFCNRDIVDDEIRKCGIHARRVREQERFAEERRMNEEMREAIAEGVREVVEKLKKYGIEATVHRQYDPDGQVVLDGGELLQILEDYIESVD